MSNQHRLKRLVQLNAIADRALEIKFSFDEDESHLLRNTAIGGTALAGGAYLAGRGVPGPVRQGARGISDTMMAGAKRVGSSIGGAYDNVKDTYMKGYTRGNGSIMRGVRGVLRSITKGKSKLVGMSSRHNALVQLSEKLDEAMKFESLANLGDAPGGYKRPFFGVLAAKKGSRWDAAKEVAADGMKHDAKFAGVGAGIGGLAGLIAAIRGKRGFTKRAGLARGAAVGGLGGLLIGSATGPSVNDRKYDRHFQ